MTPTLVPTFYAGKLLLSMVPRNKGDQLVAVTKTAGARGGTITPGRAVVDNKILQMLSLADTLQDIVVTVMRDEAGAVLEAVRAAYANKKLCGLALVLDVSGLLVRVPAGAQPPAANISETRREKMESGYTLLNVIVNYGYADDVMAEARKAGATGGTIMNARGTGTEEDVKFFGITLVPEKETVMIVADNSKVNDIVAAICKVPTLSEPGGGIVYTQNVEEFIVLGQK